MTTSSTTPGSKGNIVVRLQLVADDKGSIIPLEGQDVKLIDPSNLRGIEKKTKKDGKVCFKNINHGTYTIELPEDVKFAKLRYPELKLMSTAPSTHPSIAQQLKSSSQSVPHNQDGASTVTDTEAIAYYEFIQYQDSVNLAALHEFREIGTAVRDLVDFSSTEGSSPLAGRGGAPGVGEPGGRVGDVFASFLGASRATNDVNTVLRALESSFEETEDGKYIYNPRAQGLEPHGEANQLSGEQKRLYTLAKFYYDDALTQLSLLNAVANGSDQAKVTGLKASIRTQLEGLIAEFGRVDGPRQVQVEDSIESLIGISTTSPGGLIEDLKGCLPGEAEKIDMLKEDVTSIKDKWTPFLTKNLGNDLRELSHRLKQASQAVRHLKAKLRAFEPDLTLNDLIDLVDQSVSIRWPKLIAEGGRQGVKAMLPLSRSLCDKVRTLLGPSSPSPTLFDRPGIRPALKDLAGALKNVVDSADKVKK